MSLGENIRRLRKSNALTQDDLAKALTVRRQTVVAWEKDTFKPNASTLNRLAEMFGITVDELTIEPNFKTKLFPVKQSDNHQNIDTKTNVRVKQIVKQYYLTVPLKAQAGYAIGVYEPIKQTETFMRELPIDLPNPETYLSVDIADSSMETPTAHFKGISDGDTLICKEVPPSSLEYSPKNKIYVIAIKPSVDFEHGAFLVKMFDGYKDGIAHFNSTSKDYPNFKVRIDDIQKLYIGKHILPKQIPL